MSIGDQTVVRDGKVADRVELPAGGKIEFSAVVREDSVTFSDGRLALAVAGLETSDRPRTPYQVDVLFKPLDGQRDGKLFFQPMYRPGRDGPHATLHLEDKQPQVGRLRLYGQIQTPPEVGRYEMKIRLNVVPSDGVPEMETPEINGVQQPKVVETVVTKIVPAKEPTLASE